MFNNNFISTRVYHTPIQFSESFTELYFLNPQPTLVPSQIYPVSFAIRNKEQKDMQYTYALVLKKDQTNYPVTQKTIFVKENETKIIQTNIAVPRDSSKDMLFVNLLNTNQSIHMILHNPV